MTNEEALKIYEGMLKVYGTLPDVDHEPIRFKYYYTLYRLYHMKRE